MYSECFCIVLYLHCINYWKRTKNTSRIAVCHSLLLQTEYLIDCLILFVWSLHWHNPFGSFAIAVETASWLRKLIIDFIRQQGCEPLGAESERLAGTLPEWAHFLHNPPQSSSGHHHVTGEPVWHIEDYCAMLSLDVNTQWPVKCSWTKLQQPVVALMRGRCIHGLRRKSIPHCGEPRPHF